MGKIIISESQYMKVKQNLIEAAINESLLNEQTYKLDPKKYTLKTEQQTTAYNSERKEGLTVIGGITYVPTQRGNLTGKGEIEYANSGGFKKTTTTITFMCKTAQIHADGEYYDVYDTDPNLKGLQELCKSLKNKRKSYGIQQTAGEGVKGYTQKYSYPLKSKDGNKTILIPAKTGYTAKKDQDGNEGATFKLDVASFGWFGCKSKSFYIDKVLYVDEKGWLTNNLSKSVCSASTGEPKVKPKGKKVVSGTGGRNNINQDSIVLDMLNYV